MSAAARKAELVARLPVVFGLGAVEAAGAVGVSVTLFRQLVDDRVMPPARRIRGRFVWDVDELRAAFKDLPHDGEAGDVDTWADVG